MSPKFPRSITVVHSNGISTFAEGRVRPLLGFLARNVPRVVVLTPRASAQMLAPEFPTIEFVSLLQMTDSLSRPAVLMNLLTAFSHALVTGPKVECVLGMCGLVNDALAVRLLATRVGAKAVIYVDNMPARHRPGPKWWTAIDVVAGDIAARVYPTFDAVLASSPVTARQLIALGVPSGKLALSGLGLDEKSFRIAEESPPARKPHHCTFVGRINVAKGIFDLLRAWPTIVSAIPDATLTVIGSGDNETVAQFRKTLAATPHCDRIAVLGYVDGVTKYRELWSSKAFLFPSYSEMNSSAIREALACGNSVVCYDAPGILDHFEGDVSVGPLGDAEDFAQRAIAALTLPTPPLGRAIDVSYEPCLTRDFIQLAMMLHMQP